MIKHNYTILAIETSLDDTCAAVTVDDRVVSNVVASQVTFHEEFGGTVPHVAKRMHEQWLKPTIEIALKKARLWKSGAPLEKTPPIDAVAVTYGPGLAPCLEVGMAAAKELSRLWKKPLIAVNHMEGHLLSSFAKNVHGFNTFSTFSPQHPVLGFLISGGHTQLVLMNDVGNYTLLGETHMTK
jgi:N6-L-threonylcarbamoyladenine synthase